MGLRASHTRLHTDHALENLRGLGHEQGMSDEGGGLHAESNMAALVLFFFPFLCVADCSGEEYEIDRGVETNRGQVWVPNFALHQLLHCN